MARNNVRFTPNSGHSGQGYERYFADAIAGLKGEGRYRIFADLERCAGRSLLSDDRG